MVRRMKKTTKWRENETDTRKIKEPNQSGQANVLGSIVTKTNRQIHLYFSRYSIYSFIKEFLSE